MHNTASHSRCIAGQSVCPQKQCCAAAMVLQVRSELLLQPATTTLVLIPAVLAALLCSGTELRVHCMAATTYQTRHWLDFRTTGSTGDRERLGHGPRGGHRRVDPDTGRLRWKTLC